jgi:hypothetical protein
MLSEVVLKIVTIITKINYIITIVRNFLSFLLPLASNCIAD